MKKICEKVLWSIGYNINAQPTICCTASTNGTQISSYACLETPSKNSLIELEEAIIHLQKDLSSFFYASDPEPVLFDSILDELDVNRYTDIGIQTASMTFYKLCAHLYEIDLYALFASLLEYEEVTIPLPHFHFLGGKSTSSYDYFVIPASPTSYRETLNNAKRLHTIYLELLAAHKLFYTIKPSGIILPDHSVDEEVKLSLLAQAIEQLHKESDYIFTIGLDAKGTQNFDLRTNAYKFNRKRKTQEEMIAYYTSLVEQYPIVSFIEPFSEKDLIGIHAWHNITTNAYEELQFQTTQNSTDPLILSHACRINPLQYKTTLEALSVVSQCNEQGKRIVITWPSEHIDSSWLADFAIGSKCEQIILQGIHSAQNMCFYNRVLNIEHDL